VIQNNINVIETGDGTQKFTNVDTYTGTTTVNGGKLEVATGGQIRGSSSITVNTGGTFEVSSTSNNVVSVSTTTDYTPVTLGGGNLKLADTLTGNSQRFGTLSVPAGGTLDFGTGNTNSLVFTSLTAAPTSTVTVAGWTGTLYSATATVDSNDATQDRLLFANTLLSGGTNLTTGSGEGCLQLHQYLGSPDRPPACRSATPRTLRLLHLKWCRQPIAPSSGAVTSMPPGARARRPAATG